MAAAKQRHLNRAPITEAVVDLRCEMERPCQAETLRGVAEALRATYPVLEEQRTFEGGITVVDNRLAQFARDLGTRGYVLKSEEEPQVLQVQVDGLSFSRLRPYTDGDVVMRDARAAWATYSNSTPVKWVTRIALRYINRFTLPSRDVARFLTGSPSMPVEVEVGLVKNSMSTFHVEQQDGVTEARIMTAISFDATPSVLLDIDCFRAGPLRPDAPEIWEQLRVLRDTKNKIFFGSITEELAREFE